MMEELNFVLLSDYVARRDARWNERASEQFFACPEQDAYPDPFDANADSRVMRNKANKRRLAGNSSRAKTFRLHTTKYSDDGVRNKHSSPAIFAKPCSFQPPAHIAQHLNAKRARRMANVVIFRKWTPLESLATDRNYTFFASTASNLFNYRTHDILARRPSIKACMCLFEASLVLAKRTSIYTE